MKETWRSRIVRPAALAQHVRHLCGDAASRKPRLTLLVGAGFSVSAGIPGADAIVTEHLEKHVLLQDAGATPNGISKYAYLMGRLPPADRMQIIEACIAKAQDGAPPRTKLNWAHLLAATLVYHGYVKQILTTNFDPLLVDAMAITGQPVQVFDLTSTEFYMAGRASRGALMYLHGQANGLLQAHSEGETARVRGHIRTVLQEALQDSTMVVIGYSGECDPVFAELRSFPQFRHRLYWAFFSRNQRELPEHVREFIESPGREAQILCDAGDGAEWMDADTTMHRLVIDELKLDLPPLIANPLAHLSSSLRRLCGSPKMPRGRGHVDPAADAKALVERASALLHESESLPTIGGSRLVSAERAARTSGSGEEPGDTPLTMQVTSAAMFGDVAKLHALKPIVERQGDESLRKRLGDGFRRAAARLLDEEKIDLVSPMLEAAEQLGTSEPEWLCVNWGILFAAQARRSRGAPADELFQRASRMYEAALAIKPDMHEALSNWAAALWNQAKQKVGAEAKDCLRRAGEKCAAALAIRPEKHEALNNWGNALSDEAKLSDGADADDLFRLAGEKYSAALRIKPDKHEALSNWGAALSEQAKQKSGEEAQSLLQLARQKYAGALDINPRMPEAVYNMGCLEAASGNTVEAVRWLDRWLRLDAAATRQQIDDDSDFDRVRGDPCFQAFLASAFAKGGDGRG